MKPRPRLPAYGRQVKNQLGAGFRPAFGGGAIIVTTEWDYASAYTRLVCSPDIAPQLWDLSYLRGNDVVILVPHRHRGIGEALTKQVRRAGAALAVLAVHAEGQP